MMRKIFMAAAIFSFCLMNVCAAAVIESGLCGENVSWTLDSDGTLTISGNGEMNDYLMEDKSSESYGWFYYTPWEDFKNQITKIVILDGVKNIGSHAFTNLDNLKTVTIAKSVTFIGSQAFVSCKNLTSVILPQNVKSGNLVFNDCPRLSEMSITSSSGKKFVASNNLNAHEYTRHANPIKSYLYADGGNLIRFENIGNKIVVEKYSPDFELISSENPQLNSLEIWGGFFAGQNFNFVITGNNNDDESDSVEVIRVSKYDKNWNYISDAKIFGANTEKPFVFASLRCAEDNGTLYVRTAHQMYKSPDGLNHQASMAIVINEADMKVKRLDSLVTFDSMAYVSHSFNQFVLIDNLKNILMFDQGDAYPRGAVLIRDKNNVEVVNWAGNTGDNATGASIGGLAETANNYVTAYNYDGVGGSPDDYFGVVNKRDLYVAFTSKNNFSNSGTRTLKIAESAGTPILVPVNKNGGYIFWDETKHNGQYYVPSGKIFCAQYDNSGNVSIISSTDGQLSDCQPIIFNGKITWYVTNNSAPVFYTFDGNNFTVHEAR